jgi:hypothetical protein
LLMMAWFSTTSMLAKDETKSAATTRRMAAMDSCYNCQASPWKAGSSELDRDGHGGMFSTINNTVCTLVYSTTNISTHYYWSRR